MSKWGIAVCIVLAAVAEGAAKQWPQYAIIGHHLAGAFALLPVNPRILGGGP